MRRCSGRSAPGYCDMVNRACHRPARGQGGRAEAPSCCPGSQEGAAMFVRVGTFRIRPGTLDEFRQRYYSECAPLVKGASGSVDCMVLEPVDDQGPLAVGPVCQPEPDAPPHAQTAPPAALST